LFQEAFARAKRQYDMNNIKEKLHAMIEDLEEDELTIAHKVLSRLVLGHDAYGAWQIEDDPRDYTAEALEEVVDALHYCIAAIVQARKANE
jgi:hypothetical protein